jgi:ribosomal protein L37E
MDKTWTCDRCGEEGIDHNILYCPACGWEAETEEDSDDYWRYDS